MADQCRSGFAYFLAGLGIASVLTALFSWPAEEESAPALSPQASLKGGPMQEEIGTVAGDIWKALHAKGELTLAQLKKQVKARPPVMDWAIGWLAREGKVQIKQEKRTVRIRLQ